MQLSYRGNHYNHENIPVDMVETGRMGTYRGQHYAVNYPRHIPVPQPVHTLTYRGAAYRTTVTGQTVATAQPVKFSTIKPSTIAASTTVAQTNTNPVNRAVKRVSVPSNARWHASKSHLVEYEQTHQRNIQRRLQQRIEAAKARGDYKLLNELQHEMQQAG